MSDPSPLTPPPEQTLAYRGQQEYRPTSALQPKAALFCFAVGFLCAALVAGIAVAWYVFRLPSIIGLAGLAQGLVLGLLLLRVFRRAKLHSLPAAIVITLLLALACNVLTYAGLYVRQVYALRDQVRRDVAAMQDQPGLPAMLMNFTDRPFAFYDNVVLRPETGRVGFVGFLLSKGTMTLGNRPTTALEFFIVNGLLLMGVTYKVGKSQVLEPFCEQCGSWFGPASNAAVLPARYHDELVAAVNSGDPAAAISLNREAANGDLGAGCAVAEVRKCPGCGQTFAQVVLKFASEIGVPATRPVRITPEMLQALKSEPVVPVAEPEADPEPDSAAAGARDQPSAT